MKTKILAGLAVAAIAIQFIPYGKDHTNPPHYKRTDVGFTSH